MIDVDPTDRAKAGTKYHIAVTGNGMPVACPVTGANVNGTVLFGPLFLGAMGGMARIAKVSADKGYDAKRNRQLCLTYHVAPFIHERKRPSGFGLGRRRRPVERTIAWLLEDKRLGLRYDRCGFIIEALLQTACILLVTTDLANGV